MEYINSRVDREGADLDQVCITKDNEPSVTTASLPSYVHKIPVFLLASGARS
jgi:hypothetical protein